MNDNDAIELRLRCNYRMSSEEREEVDVVWGEATEGCWCGRISLPCHPRGRFEARNVKITAKIKLQYLIGL